MLLSPNLSLDYIDVNAAQREVVHNAAIRELDALVQLAVLDRDLATPPGSPSNGQRWIVAASPTGGWAGHATQVAAWQDGAWRFYVPRVGWLVFVIDEGKLVAWSGSAWVDALSMLTTLQNLVLLGVGTTADSTNPFSAKLNNTLWVAKTVAEGGDGNLRYKLSKESVSKTLSLLMQTNFSGRAEIGLTGDDDFHVKVSPDGSTWYEAMVLSKSSGQGRLLSPLAIFDSASYAAGVGGVLQLQANNASAGRLTFASVCAYATAGTAGAEIGDLVLKSMNAGTLTEALRLLGSGTAQFAGGATFAGALALTTASANALAVGRLGTTTPAFLVDASTAGSITGLKAKSAASGGGVALSAIGETNVNLTIDAAGAGTITIGGTSTGAVVLPASFITGRTEDTSPDSAADFLLTSDTSASGALKKILLHRATAFKTGSFTRDATTASGTQVVTGVGFKPKTVIFFTNVNSTSAASWGMDDGVAPSCIVTLPTSWVFAQTNAGCFVQIGASDSQGGSVASFDSDGFTMTWTKSGSPTGTITVKYLALR